MLLMLFVSILVTALLLSAYNQPAKFDTCYTHCHWHRWAAYPPPEEKLDMLFKLGFTDTLKWLKENRHKLRVNDPPSDGTVYHAPNGMNGKHQTESDTESERHQAASDTESEEPVEDVERSIFSQVACQAPSCDETLKEAVVGKPSQAAMQNS